jgi:hypothetical protein
MGRKKLVTEDLWFTGNPLAEARALYGLVERGEDTVDGIRELIVAVDGPTMRAAPEVDKVLKFRREVLRYFDGLVGFAGAT